jgi:hypothetical protein
VLANEPAATPRQTVSSSSSPRHKYTKVLEARKHPIRGLWRRNGTELPVQFREGLLWMEVRVPQSKEHPKAIFPGESGLLGNGLLAQFGVVTIDAKAGRLIPGPVALY